MENEKRIENEEVLNEETEIVENQETEENEKVEVVEVPDAGESEILEVAEIPDAEENEIVEVTKASDTEESEDVCDENECADEETELESTDETEFVMDDEDAESMILFDEDAEAFQTEFKKQRLKKLASKISVIVAAIVVIFAIWHVCVTNGIGSNTVVSNPIEARLMSRDDETAKYDIKYENPVMSIVKGKDAPALTINNVGVSRGLLQYMTNSMALNEVVALIQSGEKVDLNNFDWNAEKKGTKLSYLEYVKGQAVNSLVTYCALLSEGKKNGVNFTEKDEKELSDWIDGLKQQYGDQYDEVLKKSGYDDEKTLIEFQRIQALMQMVYNDIFENAEKYVSLEDAKNMADESKITAKHIMITPDSSEITEELDEEEAKKELEEEVDSAKKKAEDVLAKIKAGEDFDELMAANSGDSQQPKSGYTFSNDEKNLPKEFVDAAFELELGEVSDVVETSFGYHIIKRVDRMLSADECLDVINKKSKTKLNKNIYDNMSVTVNLYEFLGNMVNSEQK